MYCSYLSPANMACSWMGSLCHTSPFDFTRRYILYSTCFDFQAKMSPLQMMPLVEPVSSLSAEARKNSIVMYAGCGIILSAWPFLPPTTTLQHPCASTNQPQQQDTPPNYYYGNLWYSKGVGVSITTQPKEHNSLATSKPNTRSYVGTVKDFFPEW